MNDEHRVLQIQVVMMHTQLQYERYKSEMHSLRNRRLFSNLQRSLATQTEVDCLMCSLISLSKLQNKNDH